LRTKYHGAQLHKALQWLRPELARGSSRISAADGSRLCSAAGRWLALGGVAALLLLFATACSAPPSSQRLFAIGETAELDGWRITVQRFTVLPSHPVFQPQPGQVLCAVEVTLQNASGRIRFVMPERQMLLEAQGRTYALDRDATLLAARLRQWIVPEGELSVNETARGAASYQIPLQSQDVRWTFASGLLPWSERATFSLGDTAAP